MHPQVTHTHTHTRTLIQTQLNTNSPKPKLYSICFCNGFVCCGKCKKPKRQHTRNTGGCYSSPFTLLSFPPLPLLLPARCVTQISPAGKTSLLIHNSIGARRALLFACDLTSIFPVVFFIRFILPTFPPSSTFSSL